jgi:hypothetical protein
MALDSKAFFAARLNKLELGSHKDQFERLGWDTMAKFGFAANYVGWGTDHEESVHKDKQSIRTDCFLHKERQPMPTSLPSVCFHNSLLPSSMVWMSQPHVPGRSDETPFVAEVVRPLFDNDNPPEKSSVRRLFFEAYTMAANDIARRSRINILLQGRAKHVHSF